MLKRVIGIRTRRLQAMRDKNSNRKIKFNDYLYVSFGLIADKLKSEENFDKELIRLSSVYTIQKGDWINGQRIEIRCLRHESQGLVSELKKLGLKVEYTPFPINAFVHCNLKGKADIAKEIAQNLSSSLSKLIMNIIEHCTREPLQLRVNQDKKMVIGRDFSNKCETEIAYVAIIKGNLCIIDTTDKTYPSDVLTINDKFEIIDALLKLLG